MNSQDSSSPFRPRSAGQQRHHLAPRPHVPDETLKAGELHVERKDFVFLLKENPRGRFLRIIEMSGKISNSIVIPSTGLNEFKKLLAEMLKAAEEIPPK
jgi:hypothetical protein